MIRQVGIRHYKSLRDVRVSLERLTVFVGPNASGKSSILQAIHLLCQAFQSDQNVEGALVRGWSRGAPKSIELAAERNQKWYRYRVGGGQLANGNQRAGSQRETAAAYDAAHWLPLTWPQDQAPLPRSVLLALEVSKLVATTYANPDPAAMAPDGTGMHEALASMALNDPDSWQALQADLRRIIPTIRRLRHARSAPHQPNALLFDTVGAEALPADQVSEGTLLVLGLLTALYAPNRPNLMLLDDLDRGLHPLAQKDLVALLRTLLETNPDLQIVASTHSPYLLDWVEHREVRITCLREDGATVCGTLDAHPKFSRWKEEMAPGELWSLLGEKWLVEQGVAS